MAVYFEPQRRPGIWESLLGEIVSGVGGNFLNGMFQRDAAYKEGLRNQKANQAFAEAIKANPTREGLLDAAAAGRLSPEQTQNMVSLYKNQFETGDKLNYGDQVAGRLDGREWDVRKNPNEAMNNSVLAQIYGAHPEDLMKYIYPNFTSANVDLGDRNQNQILNPRTGEQVTSEAKYGVNPTKKYLSDADTQQANIAAGAQRYTADMNYKGKWVPSFQPVYGNDGTVYSFSNRGGAPRDTGVKAAPKNQTGVKTMTPKQRGEMLSQALTMVQNAGSPEEAWDMLANISGGDPQVLSEMAKYVYGSKNIVDKTGISDANRYYHKVPVAAKEFFSTGNIRNSGGQAQSAQSAQTEAYFPKEQLAQFAKDKGMTLEQAKKYVISQGVSIR
ncbi:hypothetical protein [Cloacibacillus evryensis]|uniref:hypothetical protein n=1 Tax=Cloacibacillus evryensis TaxID=508460 RepID=UPI002B21CDC1|nr:hypothetical protein [Cloacibacillus evryensis]MEA5034249.1 hypothetical protein [Cloacibacillus evryensis]